MIVVHVELWSARTGVKSTLATMHITNDGTGTHTLGNYDAMLFSRNGRRGRSTHAAGHHRLRDSVWILVLRILQQLYKSA